MKIGKQITLITPYLNFREITTSEALKEYQDSIANDEYTVYGEPNFTPDPNNSNDALLVVFDRKTGAVRKTKFDYYITPEGQIYKTLKNGKKGKLSEGLKFQVTFDDGDSVQYAVYHLVLWSYYTNLNWYPFCLATNATVDHINGDHKLCHFKYLEAVTGSENTTRSKLTPKAEEANLKSAKSRGKAFNIFVNNEKLDGEFYSTADGASHLHNKYKVDVKWTDIANCLRPKHTKTCIYINDDIITFDYTDEYKQSQEDLEGEIWYYEKDWKQKEKLKKKGFKGKAISNMGRIINHQYQKVYGSQVEGELYSIFGSSNNPVHILVWLAFSNEEIKNEILHDNYHISNKFDENGVLIRYSNAFDSLRLGTQQDNMNDMSKDKKTAAEMILENKFTVRDPDGNIVMTSHYVPECVKQLNILYKDNITFHSSCIRKCLNGNYTHHQNFTFKKE